MVMAASEHKAATQIKELQEELARERANSIELNRQNIVLMNEKVAALVEAASAKATVEQLKDQLRDKSKQMEQWVSAAHRANLAKAAYLISELSGSVIM